VLKATGVEQPVTRAVAGIRLLRLSINVSEFNIPVSIISYKNKVYHLLSCSLLINL
jgi:hypothetical protein